MKKTVLLASLAWLAITPPLAAHEASAESLQQTVEKLVSFGTRHTLSSPDHPTRGIGAARKWAASEFEKSSAACDGCLEIEMLERKFTGRRAPGGVNVVDVLAIQKGRLGWDHVIIIAGHIDSRVTDPMDFTSDAPGANDDGSGTALVIEAARIMSHQKFDATIVYALLSGEEQGLWGGRLLAETARARGWKVAAMLNNDIVGGSVGTDGRVVAGRVRVFSEGIRSSENMAEMMQRRGSGGEDDGASRSLMRYAKQIGKNESALGLEVFGVRRPDRFRRGGDHLPSLEMGYPAVRFTVGVENYRQQHQDLRSEKGVEYGDTADKMDFNYLERVTKLNVAVASALANAPLAPSAASLGGAVSSDTIVNWSPVKGASGYRIYYRRSDERDWQKSVDVSGGDTKTHTLKGIIVDDHFAGVAALDADGNESIVTFAGLPQRNR
ncbi:MAG: M28 family metallopeptidase [Sphingorhabdus sp.]